MALNYVEQYANTAPPYGTHCVRVPARPVPYALRVWAALAARYALGIVLRLWAALAVRYALGTRAGPRQKPYVPPRTWTWTWTAQALNKMGSLLDQPRAVRVQNLQAEAEG